MNANSMCISCLLSRQEKTIRDLRDENKKSEYMHRVLEILFQYGQSESAPCLAEPINRLYEEYWGAGEDYTDIKHKYNQLLLSRENEIFSRIVNSDDCIKECIKYVSAGNYIDFSAVANVNEQTLNGLLEKAQQEMISEEEYKHFKCDLEQAKKLV